MKTLVSTLILLSSILGSPSLLAQADGPAARAHAVEEYFKVIPMRKMLTDMTREVAKQLPEEQRGTFQDLLLKNLRIDVIEAAAKKSLATHFTVDELNTFVAFIKQPAGKSAMDKMKFYMADIVPVIQREMGQAMQRAKPRQAR